MLLFSPHLVQPLRLAKDTLCSFLKKKTMQSGGSLLLEEARKNVSDYQQRVSEIKRAIEAGMDEPAKIGTFFLECVAAEIKQQSKIGVAHLAFCYSNDLDCLGFGTKLYEFKSQFKELDSKLLEFFNSTDQFELKQHARKCFVRIFFEAVRKEFADFDIQSKEWTELSEANLTISWK